jgi:hypothetical protein
MMMMMMMMMMMIATNFRKGLHRSVHEGLKSAHLNTANEQKGLNVLAARGVIMHAVNGSTA